MKNGFTLAEILITIGIIGVVSAMTIPILMDKVREKVLVHKLQDAYAIFSQAYKLAIAENGSADGWDITRAQKVYDIMKPHLKIAKSCGTGSGCYAQHYKALFNDNFYVDPNTHSAYVKGMLLNGISFDYWVNGENGCPNDFCFAIHVDVNGTDKPNQAGVDYFSFAAGVDGLRPSDGINFTSEYNETCKYKDTRKGNGVLCTKWVLEKKNMDYLRKDVSWD
ncbi:type II secretion system protein [bacterium]|nr:type II secretion system protein [bacterium]